MGIAFLLLWQGPQRFGRCDRTQRTVGLLLNFCHPHLHTALLLFLVPPAPLHLRLEVITSFAEHDGGHLDPSSEIEG